MIENVIFNEDNLETLKRIPDNYIDLTVTSPPYNVDLGNNKLNKNPYDLYDDNKEHKEYIEWLKYLFQEIYNKTKDSGRCVINIGDRQNGRIPTHSDIIQMMIEIGWLPYTTIIWDKNQLSNRAAWGSYMNCSAPSFPTPFEYILVFCKNSRKLLTIGDTDLTKDEFIKWSLAKWTFNGETRKTGHPAPFPLELPMRCVKMFSWVGSIVYDPFMGSGTTAIASIKTNRKYIGSEISDTYYKLATERIKDETQEGVKKLW